MRGVDKTVLAALPLLALLAAFWFLVLSPKRDEASKLEDDVATLQASVAEQNAIADAAEAAKEDFPTDYRRLVVLGKAVPEDADTSSLLVQLSGLATQTAVTFSSLNLAEGSGEAPAPTPAPAPTTPATAAEESEEEVASVEAGGAPVPAAPTEAAAATLPIGATVGPAGLPVMPYELGFSGDFFAIADFIGRLDKQVGLQKDGSPSVFGRLMTIDGFSLTVPDNTAAQSGLGGSIPTLDAQFAVTTYVTPETEGLTAGASPSGPAATAPTPAGTTPTAPVTPPAATVGAAP